MPMETRNQSFYQTSGALPLKPTKRSGTVAGTAYRSAQSIQAQETAPLVAEMLTAVPTGASRFCCGASACTPIPQSRFDASL